MIFLAVIFAAFSFAVQDTIPPVVQDTIPAAVQDTIPPAADPDTTLAQEPEEIVVDTVYVWEYSFPEAFTVAETDSTLRWTSVLNLFNRFHMQRGAITYRTGTVGRMDGVELHAFETRHLNLELEGMELNDPLTGAVNWNRLPIHKIRSFNEADYGASYRAQTRLRDHYLVQPRTYLNFDESKFNYRSLEFTVTQNIRKSTNLELSFWDRRDGGGYQRQEVEGRQGFARVYHQLSESWLLKAAYINNAMDRQEPFGYSLTDPRFFPFNRFIETPLQPSARSNQTSSDVYLQAHYRRDRSVDVSSEFGLHYQVDKWSLSYVADTVATEFGKIELFARQNLDLGNTRVTGTGRLFLLNEREQQNISVNRWLGGKVDFDLSQTLTNWSRVNAHAAITAFDDNRASTEFTGRIEIQPFSGATLSAHAGVQSRAPDIQSLYWQSNEFTGSSTLQNELSFNAGSIAVMDLGRFLTAGIRADFRDTENAVFINSEGSFVTIDPYQTYSGTGWLSLDSRIFEGELSATYKSFQSASSGEINQILNTSGDRVWIKSHLYWKNYLFDNATYVTAGLSGMISPNPFRTAEFIPELNRWQHGTNEFVNPSFYRLDLDISARIRWFMLLIKWENILDRIDQLGYFESVGYPMPERRFMLGLRVLFTN